MAALDEVLVDLVRRGVESGEAQREPRAPRRPQEQRPEDRVLGDVRELRGRGPSRRAR